MRFDDNKYKSLNTYFSSFSLSFYILCFFFCILTSFAFKCFEKFQQNFVFRISHSIHQVSDTHTKRKAHWRLHKIKSCIVSVSETFASVIKHIYTYFESLYLHRYSFLALSTVQPFFISPSDIASCLSWNLYLDIFV